MPRYDIPGRDGPMTLTLSESHRVHRFPLPYTTDDPVECALIQTYPGVIESPPPKPKSFKPEPHKEV